jgi:UDP-N-acetylmuramyl pentapeptide phosphotransferase/UDP-N-acetylglucosamine-1-phosphate transferase
MRIAGDLVIAGIVATAASAILTGLALLALRRYGIFDRPNPRSLHSRAMPRGGGVAAVTVVILMWFWMAWPLNQDEVFLMMAAALIAAIGALEDVKGMDWRLRLGGQTIAAIIAVYSGAWSPVILSADLAWLDRILVAIALLWFVNLYNFMDGIDGLAASETVIVCLGVVGVAAVSGIGGGLGGKAAVLSGAALGFLAWNWHPARIFLGDVGSLALGFLVALLLVDLARGGMLAAAVILPGYFILDATVTLIRRALRGEPFWQPHREHAYQRAVQAGMSHAGVVVRIAGLDLVLVALALFSLTAPLVAVVAAVTATVALWLRLPTHGHGSQSPR